MVSMATKMMGYVTYRTRIPNTLKIGLTVTKRLEVALFMNMFIKTAILPDFTRKCATVYAGCIPVICVEKSKVTNGCLSKQSAHSHLSYLVHNEHQQPLMFHHG